MRAHGRHSRHGRHVMLAVTVAACLGGVVLVPHTLSPAVATATGSSGPAAASDNSGCPASNPPNELALAGGTPQTAQLDTAFAEPLQVTLANTNGCPVTAAVGTPITFAAPAGGASGSFEASGSNALTVGADSAATAQADAFTANDTPGSYTVTATSAYGAVSFELTNTAAGLPATITPLTPASESAVVKTPYPKQLSARVADANGTPVVGATVTFTLGNGGAGGGSGAAAAGASFAGDSTQTTETTHSNGVATSPSFTANDTTGPFTATASVAHITEPASFTLRNLAARALRLRRIGHWQRTTTIDAQCREPLQVIVTAAGGRPVAAATVIFTLGSTGASASAGSAGAAAATFSTGDTHATVTTAANGIATSPRFSANGVAGTLIATVTLQGTSQRTRFWLRNHAGTPANISAGVAASESTALRAGFPIPLAVTVTDAHGNPVPDTPVTFTAPASGASGSFHGRRRVNVRTDTRGVAVAPPFTANELAGGYVVKATVGRGPATVFALVNQQP